MDKPTPPTSANVADMHRYQLAQDSFFANVITNGVQSPHFTNAQLTTILNKNDLSYSGRFFFNSDTGFANYFSINNPSTNPTLVLKELS
jgi:hypothetical protein